MHVLVLCSRTKDRTTLATTVGRGIFEDHPITENRTIAIRFSAGVGPQLYQIINLTRFRIEVLCILGHGVTRSDPDLRGVQFWVKLLYEKNS